MAWKELTQDIAWTNGDSILLRTFIKPTNIKPNIHKCVQMEDRRKSLMRFTDATMYSMPQGAMECVWSKILIIIIPILILLRIIVQFNLIQFNWKGVCCPKGMQQSWWQSDVIIWKIFRVIGLLCGEFTGRPWIPCTKGQQATGLDAWASRVKCPARFVSHLHEICIYIWVVYNLCFFCCLFITVTWWYVWCFEWASGNQEEVQACLVTLNTQWIFMINVSI